MIGETNEVQECQMDVEMAVPVPRRGRPASITLDVVEKVARLIAKGMTEEQACVRVGVNHSSLRTARHRNPEFETAIKEAQAEYLDDSLDRIGAGTPGWQGRAWILERRHGEQFRRNTSLEVNALVGAYSVADLLTRKQPEQLSKLEVDRSVGVWQLLRAWTPEQLERLLDRYEQEWGPMDDWTDVQLEWGAACQVRIKQMNKTPLCDAEIELVNDPVAPLCLAG